MTKVIHNLTGTKFYKIWENIKSRCLNPKYPRYSDWGGRGITVCDRWLKFENFRDDMYDSYLKSIEIFKPDKPSIERINVNGNYEPENCEWIPFSKQFNNKRINKTQKEFKAISPNGIEYASNNQSEFARDNSLDHRKISKCLLGINKTHKGWRFINA